MYSKPHRVHRWRHLTPGDGHAGANASPPNTPEKDSARCWVDTGINPVTADIKAKVKELSEESAWTSDFAPMSTSFQHNLVYADIMPAMKEALEYQNGGRKYPPAVSLSNSIAIGMPLWSTVSKAILSMISGQLLKRAVFKVYIQMGWVRERRFIWYLASPASRHSNGWKGFFGNC